MNDVNLTDVSIPRELLIPGKEYRWRVHFGTSAGHLVASDESSFAYDGPRFELVCLDLSSSFNRDVVVDTGDSTNDPFDGNSHALVEEGYASNADIVGMPADRIVGVHRLGNYRGPNSIQLRRGLGSPVRIAVPERRYATLRLLASCGYGDLDGSLVLEYDDGTTSTHAFAVDDWQDDYGVDRAKTSGSGLRSGQRIARNGMNRFQLTLQKLSDGADSALFESVVEPNSEKSLRAIVLDPARLTGPDPTLVIPTRITSTDLTLVLNVFAITGVVAE